MPLLRRLELDYIKSIEPDALSQTPLLEYLRIHGAESWKDFAPRVPRELFAEMNWIEHVEVRNFRWPPVLGREEPGGSLPGPEPGGASPTRRAGGKSR